MSTINTIFNFLENFKDEAACLEYITGVRFRNGKFCPHCTSGKVYTFKDGKTYKCASCLKKFSIKVGTIFENSKIPLRKWLLAIFILSTTQKGIASTQLASQLDVTQKTVLYMNRRIRNIYIRNKRLLAGKASIKKIHLYGKKEQ